MRWIEHWSSYGQRWSDIRRLRRFGERQRRRPRAPIPIRNAEQEGARNEIGRDARGNIEVGLSAEKCQARSRKRERESDLTKPRRVPSAPDANAGDCRAGKVYDEQQRSRARVERHCKLSENPRECPGPRRSDDPSDENPHR